MQTIPRLRLALRPSRIGCLWIAFACVISCLVLAALPVTAIVVLPCALAIAAALVRGLWRCTGRGVPALLHVGIDRRITVTGCDGRSQTGTILDDSFVGAWLTTIVWQRDGTPWWRPAASILVLPDMLPRDDFRRLRVALRYGRPVTLASTSEVDAA